MMTLLFDSLLRIVLHYTFYYNIASILIVSVLCVETVCLRVFFITVSINKMPGGQQTMRSTLTFHRLFLSHEALFIKKNISALKFKYCFIHVSLYSVFLLKEFDQF